MKYVTKISSDTTNTKYQTLTGAKIGDVIVGLFVSGLLVTLALFTANGSDGMGVYGCIGFLVILSIISIATGKKYFFYGILATVIVIGIMFGACVMMLSGI